MEKVLILCTGNSCRSQIAHAYLEYFTANKEVEVRSAGVETHGVNPRAIVTLREDGLDIGHYTSNHAEEYKDENFDYIITVCDNAKERCPWFPGNARRIHHNFPDPAKAVGTEEEIMEQFRKVRNEIKAWVRIFVEEYL
jgi:arsenate reductase